MCFMLISSHEQLEIFAPTLFKIQPLLSSILLAHPGRKEGSEWLWKSFFRSVRRELIWETLLSMDSGSADISKQLCKAGELFCKTCGPWSGSFEDFTKHIKFENHTPQVKVSTFARRSFFSLPAKFCLPLQSISDVLFFFFFFLWLGDE